MKYRFEKPVKVTIEFRKNKYDYTRKPLIIPSCTQIHLGKEIVIVYLAKDKREHRHRYYNKLIDRIYDANKTYFGKRRFVVNKVPEK